MYRSRLLAVLLVLSAFMFSCSGEDGATGPAGPPGADGNANVMVFHYGSRTSTGSLYYTFTVDQEVMEQSLVLGYYNPEAINDTTTYYPIPGLGPWSNYQTRCYTYISGHDPDQYTYQLSLMNPNGVGSYTASTVISRLRLIVCPASVINSRGSIDLTDDNAVREYLNVNE